MAGAKPKANKCLLVLLLLGVVGRVRLQLDVMWGKRTSAETAGNREKGTLSRKKWSYSENQLALVGGPERDEHNGRAAETRQTPGGENGKSVSLAKGSMRSPSIMGPAGGGEKKKRE